MSRRRWWRQSRSSRMRKAVCMLTLGVYLLAGNGVPVETLLGACGPTSGCCCDRGDAAGGCGCQTARSTADSAVGACCRAPVTDEPAGCCSSSGASSPGPDDLARDRSSRPVSVELNACPCGPAPIPGVLANTDPRLLAERCSVFPDGEVQRLGRPLSASVAAVSLAPETPPPKAL